LNIGLDFDDVTGHTHKLKSAIAHARHGVTIPPERYRRKFVVDTGILTEEQFVGVAREIYSGKHPVDPVPGSITGIQELLAEGHTVRIVTMRSGDILAPAREWLENRGIFIPITGVSYGGSKAEACAGLDVFVDDDSKNLHDLVGVVPHLLFFVWEHNAHEKEPDGAIRVHSWQEIMFCISRINQRRER
jgi:5'(3')-deoxyribonucleotidase